MIIVCDRLKIQQAIDGAHVDDAKNITLEFVKIESVLSALKLF